MLLEDVDTIWQVKIMERRDPDSDYEEEQVEFAEDIHAAFGFASDVFGDANPRFYSMNTGAYLLQASPDDGGREKSVKIAIRERELMGYR